VLNLTNWPIARKIMAALLLLALLSAGLTAFALSRIDRLAEKTRELAVVTGSQVRLYKGLNENIARLKMLGLETIVEVDPAKDARLLDEIRAEHASFDKRMSDLQGVSSEADKAALAGIMKDMEDYRALLNRGAALAARNDNLAAEALVQDQAGDIYNRLDVFFDGRSDQAEKALNRGSIEAAELSHSSSVMMLVVGLTGLLVVGGLAFAMVRTQITGPIANIVRRMSQLASGDTSIDLPGVGRKDEVGDMSRAVTEFRDAAIARVSAEAEKQRADADQARVVSELAAGLADLAEGKLTAQLRGFPASYAVIERDFNHAVDGLRSTIEVIARTTGGIRTGAAEVDQASSDLSLRTEQQAASLEETAAAMEQINTTVRQTADNASKANIAVSQARADTVSGSDVVQQTVSAMAGIERSSQEIAEIIAVIDGIAFQTNLLALNAGVEAARAGDAGRGFAVVASEVRALAQRAADAAKDVRERITSSSSQVENGVRLVAEAGEALGRINERVQQVNHLVSEIATAAEEQASSLGQVNTAVGEMDSVTQRNAAMVEECAAASRSLASDAEQLFAQIARFELGLGETASLKSVKQPAARAPERTRSRGASAPIRGNLALASAPDDDWTEF
jgi:methyl-accepting chemotaxis protein